MAAVVLGLGDEPGVEHLVQHDVAHDDRLGGLGHHEARLAADLVLDRLGRWVQADGARTSPASKAASLTVSWSSGASEVMSLSK